MLEARISKCEYAISHGGNRAAILAELMDVFFEGEETGNRLCVGRLKQLLGRAREVMQVI